MFARLLCKVLKHRRSGRQAKRTADGVVSVCRRCGVPMRRNALRRWVVWQPPGDQQNARAGR